MVDPQLAEACRLQAEQCELAPALTLLQQRGKLGAPLLALAQAIGIQQNQLQKPVEPTSVSHARALNQRLVEAGVQLRQQGLEPAIYFAPLPRAAPTPPVNRPKPPPPAPERSPFLKPPAPAFSPRPSPPTPAPLPAPVRAPTPPRPQLNLSVSFSIERDRAGQVVLSNVRLSGPDGANYKILAQPQDEVSSPEGLLRSLGIIVELDRR